jgi:hypothetical protein
MNNLLLTLYPLLFSPPDDPSNHGGNKDMNTLKPTADPGSPVGVYVPLDLEDAFVELERMIHPMMLQTMRKKSEDQMHSYHFGLGMWMRNHWGLWQGSRLSRWFNDRGVHHPDNMTAVILETFWRRLNGLPLMLEDKLAAFKE